MILHFQVQVQKLNRASRLLLGALIEAYDVLQQLQAEYQHDGREPDAGVVVNLKKLNSLVTGNSVTQNQPSEEPRNNNELTIASADNQIIVPKDDQNTKDSEEKDSTEQHDKDEKVGVVTQVSPSLPDIVMNPAAIVRTPVSRGHVSNMPDIIMDTLHATKKTSPRKTPRKVFRLNTLREMHQRQSKTTKDTTTPTVAPLTWSEAGAKLRNVASTWETLERGPRRPSLPALGALDPHHSNQRRRLSSLGPTFSRNPEEDMSDDLNDGPQGVFEELRGIKTDFNTEHMINNVLKAVQVFGLFLIIRKFENMLK